MAKSKAKNKIMGKVKMVGPKPKQPQLFWVADTTLWGKLVKVWATGKPRDGVPLVHPPRTLEELQQQCDDIGLEIKIPAYMKGLVIVSQNAQTLAIRLPSASMIEKMEDYLSHPETAYPKSEIYELYEEYEDENGEIKKEKQLDLHDARIGDYTIAQCH